MDSHTPLFRSKNPGTAFKAILIVLGLGCVWQSCSNTAKRTDGKGPEVVDVAEFAKTSNAATVAAQTALLAALGNAIANDGFHGAIAYCNLNATGLTDSISREQGVAVARVTNRHRNPQNVLVSQEDKRAWTYYKTKSSTTSAKDTVLLDRAGVPHYYKPIWIASALCLNCHGSRSTEVALETLEAIDERYPEDAAVNYRMGELRGLWKVEPMADAE